MISAINRFKTRTATSWLTRKQTLIPNGVKCNVKSNWGSVPRLVESEIDQLVTPQYNWGSVLRLVESEIGLGTDPQLHFTLHFTPFNL